MVGAKGWGMRIRAVRIAAAVAAAGIVTAGCGGSGSPSGAGPDAGTPKASAATVTSAPASPAGAETRPAAPGGYDPARNASADIAAAKAASAKDGKPVLLDFGANWCPDCVVLGRTFTRPATAALLADYHVVRVDVGQFDHNVSLASRYVDLRTSGIPALAVVDARGRLQIATNQGQFANARSMPEASVDAFLKRWA